MTEAYIHFIWKLKRLPFHRLTTTEGKPLSILHNGIHNLSESGPDFFNARIVCEGMEWAGQIEMHIRSSDWYKHKHHTDEAYDNVILHVVYEHDREILLNGTTLPTVELKNLIDKAHYARWEQFANAMKDIPCEDSLNDIDVIFLKTMIHRAITDRLNRKTDQLLYLHGNPDNPSVLYYLLACAFGTKINALPFELLTNQLPFTFLQQFSRPAQKRLLLQTSGLYNSSGEDLFPLPLHIQVIAPSLWKRKGLRPTAFPEKRILQFAEFISNCDFELLAAYLSPNEAYDYTRLLISQVNKTIEYPISIQLFNQLFVNAFIPYYWLKAVRMENGQLQEFILSFMERLRPEDNFILKKWRKAGVYATNAYESQALIELYNEYCSHKKCLSCQIGVKILNGQMENA